MSTAAIVLSDRDSLTGGCEVFYRTRVPEYKYGEANLHKESSDPRNDSPTWR